MTLPPVSPASWFLGIGAVFCLAGFSKAAPLALANGDFEKPGLGAQEQAAGIHRWFDDTGKFAAWQQGRGRISGKKKSQHAAIGHRGWMYQPIGRYSPAEHGDELTYVLKLGAFSDGVGSAPITVSLYRSDAFKPADGSDVRGATGVTQVGKDQAFPSYDQLLADTGIAPSGGVDVGGRFSLKGLPAGAPLYLRIANHTGAGFAPVDDVRLHEVPPRLPAKLKPSVIEIGKPPGAMVLDTSLLARYVRRFNADDYENVKQSIPNERAWDFLDGKIPLFDCPDEAFRRTYYFRWWTFRKHIRRTPDGFVVTEFLPRVGWAGEFNTINAAAGHHFYEGRWHHDARYLKDYARFWLEGEGRQQQARHYSTWLADSLRAFEQVHPDRALLEDLFPDLVDHHQGWAPRDNPQAAYRDSDGFYWQSAGPDAMEVGVSGDGKRPSINTYLFADKLALTDIAGRVGEDGMAKKFRAGAEELRSLILKHLWDADLEFFVNGHGTVGIDFRRAKVREQIGFTPWMANLPPPGRGYGEAWRQLMDPQGFYAPFGPTTAERRHPGFALRESGHECQWNGPSWPYSTTITLRAMANFLHDYPAGPVGRDDYFKVLGNYARSHQLTVPGGELHGHKLSAETIPWIDENLNPDTGEWLARKVLGAGKGERGKDYNHSGFVDLIVTGLVGLRPETGRRVRVHPLLPEDAWDWFALDNIRYRGASLTIIWDRNGKRYGRGRGLKVFADGTLIASAEGLVKVTGQLPE